MRLLAERGRGARVPTGLCANLLEQGLAVSRSKCIPILLQQYFFCINMSLSQHTFPMSFYISVLVNISRAFFLSRSNHGPKYLVAIVEEWTTSTWKLKPLFSFCFICFKGATGKETSKLCHRADHGLFWISSSRDSWLFPYTAKITYFCRGASVGPLLSRFRPLKAMWARASQACVKLPVPITLIGLKICF